MLPFFQWQEINLGFVQIQVWGLMVALSLLTVLLLAYYQAKKKKLSAAVVLDLGFWVVLSAMLGGRFFYLVEDAAHYLNNPIEIFKIWEGGMSISGGFLCTVWVVGNETTAIEPRTWVQQNITRAGWVLIFASFGLWAVIPVLPFLPFSTTQQVAALGSILISAEIVFWLGALMAGPDAMRRMKSWWSLSADEDVAAAQPLTADVQERVNPS